MKKISFVLVATAFLFTSCKKEHIPEPPPPSELQLSRSFYYPASTVTVGISYSPNDVEAAIHQIPENNKLAMSFSVPAPKGKDAVLFAIENSKLKPGYVGKYSIVKGSDGNLGDVKAQYNYLLTANSANLHLPGMAEGELTITNYDQQNNMLSGSYSFDIISQQDPMVGNPVSWKESKISVGGSFKNVVIHNK